MGIVRVHGLSISLDGFVAGPDQSLERPIGEHGEQLHRWVFATAFGRAMTGQTGGTTGVDDAMAVGRHRGVGASLMGRNMFGPVRGPWEQSEPWDGWWGEEPPFHHDVVVMTHFPREPLEMLGGTTFHFETGGADAALAAARGYAGDGDILIGGGASTVRQFLERDLIDELHLVLVPVLLGRGESIFAGGGIDFERYVCVEHVSTDAVIHLRLSRVAR
jgi:dihydrofolate reductase